MQDIVFNLRNQLEKVVREHPMEVNEDTYWRGVKIGLETSINVAVETNEVVRLPKYMKTRIVDPKDVDVMKGLNRKLKDGWKVLKVTKFTTFSGHPRLAYLIEGSDSVTV
jgi:hypothetical protein